MEALSSSEADLPEKNTLRPVALITGASGGIGAALADEFAQGGHDLVLIARNAETLATVADQIIADHGVKVTTLALDLTSAAAGDKLEAALAAKALRVEILVNNAGFGLAGQAARLDRDEQVAMVDLNVRALVDLTLRFLPEMVERRSGGILNVGSIAGFQPGPYMAGYYASKAFVGSYTAALATEVKKHGVKVTNLAPGPVATGFAKRARLSRAPFFNKTSGPTAQDVARTGYQGFIAGKRLVIPGFGNRIFVWLGKITPGWLRDKAIAYILKPR